MDRTSHSDAVMLWIGIDTGVKTGLAIWDSASRRFLSIECVKIHDALATVEHIAGTSKTFVRFEDARQRRYIPNSGDLRTEMGRRQGAGSVKRDSGIWEDFLRAKHIPYEAVAPKDNATKMNAEMFRSLTKWRGRTNEHERDAAMLVFGK